MRVLVCHYRFPLSDTSWRKTLLHESMRGELNSRLGRADLRALSAPQGCGCHRNIDDEPLTSWGGCDAVGDDGDHRNRGAGDHIDQVVMAHERNRDEH